MTTQLTYREMFSRIEKELAKEKTDRQTWDIVDLFWKQTFDADQRILDRVELLESLMHRHHGWSRD
jgi:hypothetical protein